MTDLHHAVEKLARNNPALVLSIDALRGLLVKNFVKATALLYDKSVRIEGFPKISARFTSLTADPNNLTLSPYKIDDQVVIDVTPGFTATIALHLTRDRTLEFSTIHIKVMNLKFAISANAPNLLLGAPDFDVTGQIRDFGDSRESSK